LVKPSFSTNSQSSTSRSASKAVIAELVACVKVMPLMVAPTPESKESMLYASWRIVIPMP